MATPKVDPRMAPAADPQDDDDGCEDVADYAFATRHGSQRAPREQLQQHSFHAAEAYQVIKDMRQLDQNPRLNLASFVTTWMEPEAEKVMVEALNVNFVDADQYRSCHEIEKRCICMIADLYNAPDPKNSPGAGCIGSSEAIMLGALSLKKRWVRRRKATGKDYSSPNVVMGHNIQICWTKFCAYFDVEPRYVPLEVGEYELNIDKARDLVDENTIGLVGLLGNTYTGGFDDMVALNALSDEFREKKGWEVPIHVDAASGGFVAPFLQPELEWDFRLRNVASINVSGHKYGLVYAGCGWIIFRDADALDDALVFSTNYLGSNQPNITLNFSRGASNIVAQYYQFLRLGWQGYRSIMHNLMKLTRKLEKGINDFDIFRLLSHENNVPLVAFSIDPAHRFDGEEERLWDEFQISDKMRERGWMIPAYAMAPNAQSVTCLRIVVREDFSNSMLEGLLNDLSWSINWLHTHFTFKQHSMPPEQHHQAKEDFKQAKEEQRLDSVVRGRSCA